MEPIHFDVTDADNQQSAKGKTKGGSPAVAQKEALSWERGFEANHGEGGLGRSRLIGWIYLPLAATAIRN